jgi:hypothetical protein
LVAERPQRTALSTWLHSRHLARDYWWRIRILLGGLAGGMVSRFGAVSTAGVPSTRLVLRSNALGARWSSPSPWLSHQPPGYARGCARPRSPGGQPRVGRERWTSRSTMGDCRSPTSEPSSGRRSTEHSTVGLTAPRAVESIVDATDRPTCLPLIIRVMATRSVGASLGHDVNRGRRVHFPFGRSDNY